MEFRRGAVFTYNADFGIKGRYFPYYKQYSSQSNGILFLKGKFEGVYQFGSFPVELKVTPRILLDIRETGFEYRYAGVYGEKSSRFLIDELCVDWFYKSLDIRAGYQIISWQIVESVSWIDFLNQTDLQENIFAPPKIGEIILKAGFIFPTITENYIQVFYIPVFTPGTQTDSTSRFYLYPSTNRRDDVLYGSPRKRFRPQVALSFATSFIKNIDIFLLFFNGYDRNPFVKFVSPFEPLYPKYEIVYSGGLGMQGNIKNLLYKGEFIYKRYEQNDLPSFWGGTFGLEYTFCSLFFKSHDLGIVSEIIVSDNYDKNVLETGSFNPFNSHVFLGLQYDFNTTGNRKVNIGLLSNFKQYENLLSFEYLDRMNDNVCLSIQALLLFGESGSFLKKAKHMSYIASEIGICF